MIAFHIIRRFKKNLDNIHSNTTSNDTLVTELAYILDLLRAFFIINYRKKITDNIN